MWLFYIRPKRSKVRWESKFQPLHGHAEGSSGAGPLPLESGHFPSLRCGLGFVPCQPLMGQYPMIHLGCTCCSCLALSPAGCACAGNTLLTRNLNACSVPRTESSLQDLTLPTSVCAHSHMDSHTHTHTRVNTHICTLTQAFTNIQRHTYNHTDTHLHTLSRVCIQMHTHALIHKHTHTHLHTITRTHTEMCAHTQ